MPLDPTPTPAPAAPPDPAADAIAALGWGKVLLAINLVLTSAKITAWWLTSSAAILSDALESLANVATSVASLYALWLAARPRDADHPYGHGKVEYLASGIEGALILTAGLAIFVVAVVHFASGDTPARLGLGAAIEAAVAVALWTLGTAARRAGQRLQSPSLGSGGEHLRSDAVTTAAVVVGLGAVAVTGQAWMDPAVAGVFGVVICVSGAKLLREAVGGLMDEASPALLDEIAAGLEAARQPGWSSPHHTKVHRLGQSIHIDLHLVFPRFWALEQAHDAAEQVEQELVHRFGPRTDVMIHMEPCTPTCCRRCDLPQCAVRATPADARRPWVGTDIAATRRHQA